MITAEKTGKILTGQLEEGEQLRAYLYALKGFKGHCIGLTEKKILFVRISMFLSRVKETWSVPLENLGDVHYEGGGEGALEALLVIKTKEGEEYKFKVVRAAGLSGGDNFKNAEKFYNLLINK